MKWSLAINVCALAVALVMFSPSQASAGGRYQGYSYSYGCPSYAYAYGYPRYAYGRGYTRYGRGYPRYSYGRRSPRYSYGRGYPRYGRGYPRARSYARRGARRW
jgi:hypothetical protein